MLNQSQYVRVEAFNSMQRLLKDVVYTAGVFLGCMPSEICDPTCPWPQGWSCMFPWCVFPQCSCQSSNRVGGWAMDTHQRAVSSLPDIRVASSSLWHWGLLPDFVLECFCLQRSRKWHVTTSPCQHETDISNVYPWFSSPTPSKPSTTTNGCGGHVSCSTSGSTAVSQSPSSVLAMSFSSLKPGRSAGHCRQTDTVYTSPESWLRLRLRLEHQQTESATSMIQSGHSSVYFLTARGRCLQVLYV